MFDPHVSNSATLPRDPGGYSAIPHRSRQDPQISTKFSHVFTIVILCNYSHDMTPFRSLSLRLTHYNARGTRHVPFSNINPTLEHVGDFVKKKDPQLQSTLIRIFSNTCCSFAKLSF
ncbi:hypothetical protein HMPREF1219_00764 [Corynebacterium pyruviciproducens ATCC BAA-1742]|uniref:Uncharacterized protein n=1 Tax=Corynebacterium pyruviciproducens ATCC BAA-1742 TaxID=1125779 RepID=S2Z7T4_9CORY|nr:hypothetical protein HMPREF1219_00764 [Corynebacterium pyruviciproducens ATCC BAA-1742]